MQKAFSLIELSIVLVVLGLLAGGILVGQSFIRASQLRAVTTEYNRWATATTSFRDKYYGLPGDLSNATQVWGKNDSLCGEQSGNIARPGTCNGNGDAIITVGTSGNDDVESFLFWQHLALAGLIEGTYDGMSGPATGYSGTATNLAKSRLSKGYWFVINWNDAIFGNVSVFDGVYKDNMIEIGGLQTDLAPEAPLLTPEEIWNIDKKIDDGKPAYGRVRVRYPVQCTTATTTSTLNAEYLLTSQEPCVPLIRLL